MRAPMEALRNTIFIVLFFIGIAVAALPSAPVYPTTTLADNLTPSPSASNPLTYGHQSEVAKLSKYRPPAPTITSNPTQSNCPHSLSGLSNWQTASIWSSGSVPANNSDVSIPANTNVLISSSSIPSGYVYGIITVPATSKLIFDDAPISIAATGFNVAGGMYAGSGTCRLRNKITITLYGLRKDGTTSLDRPWTKGIAVSGTIDLHGVQYYPTWTRLAMTANVNDTWIFVQDTVNWQVGQTIALSTTDLKDSRDWNRNEERVIVDIKLTKLQSTVTAIQLNQPLSYQHYGGKEYQGEVALLSRNIVVQGDAINSPPTDTASPVCTDSGSSSTYPCYDKYTTGYGAHIIVYGAAAQGRFSGVEMYRVGQTNSLGRYPIHFHLVGNVTASNYTNTYVRDCAVHDSYFRCYAIHGTQGVLLNENTAYNVIGHCYFLEDGVEEENIISYNQVAHVHPLGTFADSANDAYFWGQYLPYYFESSSLILPSDMSASGFYITNPYNDFYGNAASGGWAGFGMPSLITPVKLFKNVTNMRPSNRPFRTPFRGNSAHSTGHWWQSAGAIYLGGELVHDSSTGALKYTGGRSSTHDTCTDKLAGTGTVGAEAGCYTVTNQRWLRFEDNKVFLSNRGMQHWGVRSEIINFEIHDTGLSMNVFGDVWIDKMLMECRTAGNKFTFYNGCPGAPPSNYGWGNCGSRDSYFFRTFGGFQWYDVGQQHILTNSTFRNCRGDWNRCYYGGSPGSCSDIAVFTSLTHSDQFVPELMQVTSGIKYENVTDLWRYSTKLTDATGVTVSGRLQSWYDPDGTASQTGVRTMIGSSWSNDWWKYNTACEYYKEAYKCKLAPGDSAASVVFLRNHPDEAKIGVTLCMNGGGVYPCPIVGQASHFGSKNESAGLCIGVNAKLTGPLIAASGGWFIRFTAGTPQKLTVTSVQVSVDDIFLVALPYPAGTTFNIHYDGPSWCSTSWAYCTHNVTSVSSVDAVKKGFGDVYYWDNNAKLLYMRLVSSMNTFGNPYTDNNSVRWQPYTSPEGNFSRAGLTLMTSSYQSYLNIEASCSSNPCAAQTSVAVPNAIPIVVSTTSSTTSKTTTASTTAASSSSPSSSTAASNPSTAASNPSSTSTGDSGGDKLGAGAKITPSTFMLVVVFVGTFVFSLIQ